MVVRSATVTDHHHDKLGDHGQQCDAGTFSRFLNQLLLFFSPVSSANLCENRVHDKPDIQRVLCVHDLSGVNTRGASLADRTL